MGYFPYESGHISAPAVRKLIDEITSKEVADALGDKLGIETLVEVSNPGHDRPFAQSAARHHPYRQLVEGRDSARLPQRSWNGESGRCLRLLKSADNIDDIIVPEVSPVFGNFVMFKRADNSFHGHLPFEGDATSSRSPGLSAKPNSIGRRSGGACRVS